MNAPGVLARSLARLAPALLLLLPGMAHADPVAVELRRTDSGWALLRGGEPYTIRGAGGDASLEMLAAAGANSVRTWAADDAGALLDRAHALGLTVAVGIWLGHERHGFDYGDADQVAGQKARVRDIVLRYKDHPAVLLWGLGNEMEGFAEGDDPAIWRAVGDIAKMVKNLDPNHPTMTVTAEIGGARVASLARCCPDIDIHGINSYGGAASLPERYRAAGGEKPYILTEFGPPGSWEVGKTDWGAPLEPSSTAKAEVYAKHYDRAVLQAPGLALGAYVFLWGHKMEATATWFGMFLPDGAPLAAVDAMTGLWRGEPPAGLAPRIESLTVDGPVTVDPGAKLRVRATVSDPEEGPLRVRWALRRESKEYLTGGDFRAMLPDIEDVVVESRDDGALLRMPADPGAYRVFLYVYDTQGKAATANVPLLVRGEVRTPLPVYVYADGLEGMPWAPSGWMGSTDALSLDGSFGIEPYAGDACVRIRLESGAGWAGIAWQHPPNNWGAQDGGFDLTGARWLELWARGEYGGERIRIGVGLLGADTAHPDSAIVSQDGIVLSSDWRRYRVSLRRKDLSSIKTGFVITLSSRPTPVTVYLDNIRFVR